MTTTWDGSKKSPSAVIGGGGLVASGFSGQCCVLSTDGISSGTGYFIITVTSVGSGPKMWVGVANASHALTDNGASWAGGDLNAAGAYNDGVIWRQGSNLPDGDTFATGDTVRVDIDRDAGTFTITTNGHTYWQALPLPTGTIYAAVGFDGTSGVATADFSGLGGGATVISLAGASAGVAVASALAVQVKSLTASLAGVGAAIGQTFTSRNLVGTSSGFSAPSGVAALTWSVVGTVAGAGLAAGAWIASGPILLVGLGHGLGLAAAAVRFLGGNPWTATAIAPEAWEPIAWRPETWTRMSAQEAPDG